MGKRRNLAILAGIAVVIVLVNIIDLVTTKTVGSRAYRVFPSYDASEVVRVEFERAAGRYWVQRGNDVWRLRSRGVDLPASDAIVDDILQTVALLTWRRRRTPVRTRAAHEDAISFVDREGRRHNIRVLDAVPALRQHWIQVGGSDYLIDSHEVRAMMPSRESLRSRLVLQLDPARADRIEVTSRLRFQPTAKVTPDTSASAKLGNIAPGHPPLQTRKFIRRDDAWLVGVPTGGAMAVHPMHFRSFTDALASLAVDKIGGRAAGAPLLEVSVTAGDTHNPVSIARCHGRAGLHITAPTVRGCVFSMEALEVIRTLCSAPFDAELVGFGSSLDGLEIRHGDTAFALERAGGTWSLDIGGRRRAADGRAVAQWRAVLQTLVPMTVPVARPQNVSVVATLLSRAGGASRVVELISHGGRYWVGIKDGAHVFAIEETAAVLMRPHSADFRMRLLSAREPSTLTTVVLRRNNGTVVELKRGDTLEDWRVAPPSAMASFPRARIAGLVEELSRLYAAEGFLRDVDPGAARTTAADITLVFRGPEGEDRVAMTVWIRKHRCVVGYRGDRFFAADSICKAVRAVGPS